MRVILLVAALAWPAVKSAPKVVVPKTPGLLPSVAVPTLAPTLPVAPAPAPAPVLQQAQISVPQLPAADAPPEASAQAVGAPFDGFKALSDGPTVPGGDGKGAPNLSPSQPETPKTRFHDRVPYQSWPKRTKAAGALSDRYHYARLYFQNLYWYTVTHIKGMWPSYMKKREEAIAAGKKPSVSQARRFFSWMRVMGQSGPFYVLGFSSRHDDEMIAEAKESFAEFFDAGPAERIAFAKFTERARHYNRAKRAASNMRKHIRDAMISASLKPRSELAAHFDALLQDDKAKATEDYQTSGGAAAMLAAFQSVVNESVAEGDDAAPDRVIGVILLGSFASGSATPSSDFDVQAITANGGAGQVAAFRERVLKRWAQRQKTNPISIQDFPYPPSKALIDRIHDNPYLIVSPEPGLVEALQRKPGETASWAMERSLTLRGRFDRALQYGVVYSATLWADWVKKK